MKELKNLKIDVAGTGWLCGAVHCNTSFSTSSGESCGYYLKEG